MTDAFLLWTVWHGFRCQGSHPLHIRVTSPEEHFKVPVLGLPLRADAGTLVR
jgi:hypothetical protein